MYYFYAESSSKVYRRPYIGLGLGTRVRRADTAADALTSVSHQVLP